MADDTISSSESPPGTAPRNGSRSRRLWAALLCLILLAGAGTAWWQLRPSPLTPSDPPALPAKEETDPAIVSAVEKARQNVLAEPLSPAEWGELGMVFGAHGYDSEAGRCFGEAERLDPDDHRWPTYRGLFAGVSKPEETVSHLRRALAARSASSAAPDALAAIRLRLAETLLTQQELAESEELFRQELSGSRNNPRARFGLAQIAMLRGDRRAARDAFDALADDPYARKRAASLAAALARDDGDLNAAQRYEETARRVKDDLPWPDPYLQEVRKRQVGQKGLLQKASALEAAGQRAQATELLLESARTDPQPHLLITAGLNVAKLGDIPRAEALFQEALRLDPSNPQANYFLAFGRFERAGALEKQRPDEARAVFREAVRYGRAAVASKPDHGLAWLCIGRSLLRLGEPAEAVEPLRQAVACRPELIDPHLSLAEALDAVGERAEAVRSAQNAEKLAKPGDRRPRQLLDRLQPPDGSKK